MELKKNRLAPVMACCWLLLVAMGLNACSRSSWKEEVQLSDGRVIVVERQTYYESGGGEWAHNRTLSKPKEERILFSNPNGSGQVIEWRSTKLSPAGWPENPLILDIEASVPIVFSIGVTSTGCSQYFKYRYINGMWAEEVLPFRFESRKTNLYLRDGGDISKVTLEEKHNRNDSVDYPKWAKQVGPSLHVCG
mgnify:CR=1 FL=1